jgi:hypothetical protein
MVCAMAPPVNACPGVGLSRFLSGRKMPRKTWNRKSVREGVSARGTVDEKPMWVVNIGSAIIN